MPEELRYRMRLRATLTVSAWGLMMLGLAALLMKESVIGDSGAGDVAPIEGRTVAELQNDITALRLGLLEGQMGSYWWGAAMLVTLAAGMLLAAATWQARAIGRLLSELGAQDTSSVTSLEAVDEILAIARLQAERQREELSQLEAEIALAESIKPRTDEELSRLRQVLGVEAATKLAHWWGAIQVALGVFGLLLAVLLFKAASG